MRRVLIVDDPRLAPRLARLCPLTGDRPEVVIAAAGQTAFWRSSRLVDNDAAVITPADVDSRIPTGEAVRLVVAASSPEALAITSRLAFRRGSTASVLPDGNQSADWVFSLYPLSEGAPLRIQALFEHRSSKAVQAFGDWLPPVPGDRHLQCTCTLPTASLSAADVDRLFIEDVDLLRRLAGEFKNLIGVSVPDSLGGHRSLTVTFGGEQSGTVTWTVKPGEAFAWELQAGSGDGPRLVRSGDGEYSLGSPTSSEAAHAGTPVAPWQDVLRAFDDLAALRRSLRKRRVVELQLELISEQAQFKSLMSASGCGLLVATLLGAVALLAAGAAFDPRESQQQRSERAGLVLRTEDFRPGTTDLTEDADVEWPRIVRRLSQTAAPILVEQSDESSLDEQRRARIVSTLEQGGIASPASRVEIYRFRGGLFLKLLTVLWVVLFLPLAVFLGVQGFLLAAPADKRG